MHVMFDPNMERNDIEAQLMPAAAGGNQNYSL
jgi:hypothetical protein